MVSFLLLANSYSCCAHLNSHCLIWHRGNCSWENCLVAEIHFQAHISKPKESPCEPMVLTTVSTNVTFKQACQEFVGWFLENAYYGFIKRVLVLLKPPNDVVGNLKQGIENKSEVADVPLQGSQEFFAVQLEANDFLSRAVLRAVPAALVFITSLPVLRFLIPRPLFLIISMWIPHTPSKLTGPYMFSRTPRGYLWRLHVALVSQEPY